jgi:LmbE family N-acetylglucosaminyl deacetylase
VRSEKNFKVLAIGAHPDDFEIGACMRLVNHVKRGDDVVGVICSFGEMAGDKAIRKRESYLAAELIGMKKPPYILGFPDTHFPENEYRIRRRLEDIILTENPSIVYTHFRGDRHQDHVIVAQASEVACRRVPNIISYGGPSTNLDFIPHLYQVGSEEDFKQKRRVIEVYQSQLNRDGGVNVEQIRDISRFYAHKLNCYSRKLAYAEPFCANHVILNSEVSGILL